MGIKAKAVTWTLDTALEFIREIQPVVEELGWHTGLTGGVLQRGVSTKDVDIIFYPGKTVLGGSPQAVLIALKNNFRLCAMLRSPYHEDDTKMVFMGIMPDKRRVDLFFLQ